MDRHQPVIKRTPRGTFAKGQSGHEGHKSIFATQQQVAESLMERYTASEILDIADDKTKLDKLGTWSAIVLLQIANMLKSHEDLDYAIERERMLDRSVGKAVQKIDSKVSLSIETETALLQGRMRVAKSRCEEFPEVSYNVVENVTKEEKAAKLAASRSEA